MQHKSDRWAQSLNALCGKMALQSNDRSRLSSALLYTSNEHFFSILTLCSKNIPASAFSLMRPQYEAFTRGLWVQFCAKDTQINSILSGKSFPKSNQEILDALSKIPRYEEGQLNHLCKIVWKKSHDFTHGGGVQASWHIGRQSIGSQYTRKEIDGLCTITNSISLANSIALSELCNSPKSAYKLTRSYNRIFG